MAVYFCKCCGKNILQRQSLGHYEREKDDVYTAVKAINAMESLKVLPVRYEKLFVANKHQYM